MYVLIKYGLFFHIFRKLYWVDARNHAVFSCSFKGSNVKEQRGLKSITKGAPAYGLVVFGNTAVIGTWFSTALYSVLIGAESTVWQLEARDLGTRELYSLISLNPATQPSSKCVFCTYQYFLATRGVTRVQGE